VKVAVTLHDCCRHRNVRTTALAAVFAAIVLCAPPASAQQTPRQSDTQTPLTLAWREHPSIEIGPVHVDLRVQGIFDRRASDAALDDSDTSRFDAARRRVGIAGSFGKVAEFQVERELGENEWKDVFLNYKALPGVQIQGGHFKPPFGLDENTSSSRLDFVYRSRAATGLAPGRALGVMAHGRAGTLRYEAGVFEERTAAGRVVVQPLRKRHSIFEDVQAGVAYAVSELPQGLTGVGGDTALGRRFFDTEYAARGLRHRLGFEARWRPGPFSVQSEFVRLLDERRGQSTLDTDLPAFAASSWYLQGSWALTGERKTKGTDDPRRPLFGGGIGSIELAARIERLDFGSSSSDAVPAPRADRIPLHQDTATTFGLNWAPNRWVRLQANVVREDVRVPAGAAWNGPPVFWSRILRVRFAL
jgi:phosphate-selective porin OprO/OprP